jgi:hypothetical protein
MPQFGTLEQLIAVRPSDDALIRYLEDRIEYLRFSRKPDAAARLRFIRAALAQLTVEADG